ncbi:MAG TPA: MBOAT family O-acyltransferase [Flavobacteriales bacterium]|nr:MBOAT family O-acyltransferase [Flavobacteriales bacterium]
MEFLESISWTRFWDIFSQYPFPLVFNEMYFWLFFACIYTVYAFIYDKHRLRNPYLFFVSIFFFYKISGLFFVLLLYTAVFDFFMGRAIHSAQSKKAKLTLLVVSVTSNLALLSYFKYGKFFVDTVNHMTGANFEFTNIFAELQLSLFEGHVVGIKELLVPVGISFYTFQSISYAVDIYRGQLKPVKHFIDFAFFVSFFPQLLMGPIVRAIDFIPQIYRPYDVTKKEFSWAVFMIMKGLIKKIVVADFIQIAFLNQILPEPAQHTGFECLTAMWAYSMFIYADFSGYTDIAIGLGMLMGFRLHQNFNSPYKATSVADFWKRWHMSLSSWLRDYLYIPLGGNKKGTIGSYILIGVILFFIVAFTKMYALLWVFLMVAAVCWCLAYYFPRFKNFVTTDINLLITMIIGGLWHGPTMNFLKWGALNGIALVIYKHWKRVSPYEKSNFFLVHFWKVFITFNFITFTRIFFVVQDPTKSHQVIEQIFGNGAYDNAWLSITAYASVFILLAIAFIIHWLPVRTKEMYTNAFVNLPVVVQALIVVIAVVLIYQMASAERVPFTYTQM